MKEIFKPIFIIGVPRSGTTLLYDILAHHKDLAWFSQHDVRELSSKEFLEFLDLRRRLYDMRGFKIQGPTYGYNSRMTSSIQVPQEFGIFWNQTFKENFTKDLPTMDPVAKSLKTVISNLLTKKNKNRFLNKSPGNSMRIKYINKIFPGSIFINIIRDGRAVIESMMRIASRSKNGYFGISLKKQMQWNYDVLERHARQWIEVNEEIQNAKNSLNPEQYYEVKYENLTSNGKEILKELCKFCEIDEKDLFQKEIKKVEANGLITPIVLENLKSRNESWKSRLDESQITRLNQIMEPLLHRFEYA